MYRRLHPCRKTSRYVSLTSVRWRIYVAGQILLSQRPCTQQIERHFSRYRTSYVESHLAFLLPLLPSRLWLVPLERISSLDNEVSTFQMEAFRMTPLILESCITISSSHHVSALWSAFVIQRHFPCRYQNIVVRVRPPRFEWQARGGE